MKFLRDYIKNIKGSSAIEAAIVLPVYFAFLFGIFNFGYILWVDVSLKYAAAAAARYAYVNPGTSATAIKNYALSKTNVATGTIIYTVNLTQYSSVDIDGTFTYNFLYWVHSPITLTVHIHQVLTPKT